MNKYKKYMLFAICVSALILFTINGLSYAKYASKTAWNYYLKSKGFYFESNELGVTTKENVNNMWNGENIYFSIENYKNNSQVTESDITYTVSCSLENANTGDRCYINGTTSSSYTGILSKYQSCVNNTSDGVNVSKYNKIDCEMAGYEWLNSPTNNNLYFNVTNSNNEVLDAEAIITVTSNLPYTKTLTGRFLLHKVPELADNVTINYVENGALANVIITNPSNLSTCVTLGWDSLDFSIDTNISLLEDYKLDDNGYIKELKINLNAGESKQFNFYKTDINVNYSEEDFNLIDNGSC